MVNSFIYRSALSLLSYAGKLLGKPLPVDSAMADRMQQDLSFDHSRAVDDFAYAPAAFLPDLSLPKRSFTIVSKSNPLNSSNSAWPSTGTKR